METEMVVKVGDCILSPLGCGTLVNYEAAEKGQTSLKRYEHKWGLPEAFVASFFDEDMLSTVCAEVGIGDDYTRFERMAIVVTAKALAETDIDAASSDTMFILASTKGNVHLLSSDTECDVERLSLSVAADKIAGWFGNHRKPLVVSNACISGLHAQIEAMRILQAKRAKTVIVIAADMLSPFIVSGFQAFKTVSDELCRPFDEERLGLNLGEAAACVLYQLKTRDEIKASDWIARTGVVFNDAFHISHPSRTAEGSRRALAGAMQGISASSLAMVNVHGTATMYNDEMEAVALDRAGLSDVPINSLKGFWGHTLGAAGLLETLITMASLDNGVVLGTKGFSALGVSRNINISADNRKATGKRFIKLISGFGGCNAAMAFETIGK